MKRNNFFLYSFLILLFIAPISYGQSSDVSIEPLDNGIKQTVVQVLDSATPLPATALSGRKSLIVKNLDSTYTIYLGASDVTADEASTGGYPLGYYESFQADLGENTILYGISTSVPPKIVIIEAR